MKPVIDMERPFVLRVEAGEQVAVVGPNASGKSRMAARIAGQCDAKYITFRDSYGYSSDQNFFMQQRWNLFTVDQDTPTSGDLLQRAARSSRNPETASARLVELTKLFGLEGLMDKFLVTLSSGELRKFQLTKSLLDSPKILVIDNPYIGLDPSARALLTELLTNLAASGLITVILILSRPDEIPPFVTHVIPVGSELEKCGYAPSDCCLDGDGLPVKIVKIPVEEYQDRTMAPSVIKMNHVTIKYGSRVILNDLNWTVRQGEHWALTGANGSGKTTLLSLISADNPQAYACDIELFGRQRGTGESIWDIKKNIGYVSPEMHRAYNTDAPALDIVTSGLFDTEGLFRKPTDEQRKICEGWMEKFGAASLADRPFIRLSSGEQRLCLVIRAFVKNPPLYILDEPLHGLDNEARRVVKRLMNEQCGLPGKTLLVVTHYPEEYPACIDHSLTLTRTPF